MTTNPGDFSFPVTTTSVSDMYLPRAFGISALNSILNRSDVQLDELLNEEDLPLELRDGNPRVLDYFNKYPGKVKELIDYVIKVPLDMNDTKKAYEYPLRANEIFEADANVIMNSFFTASIVSHVKTINLDSDANSPLNLKKSGLYGSLTHLGNADPESEDLGVQKQTLLAYFFTFLDTKEELNPVLLGYFSKILLKLLRRNPRKVIDLVYSSDKITTQMAYHLGEQSIAELVPPFLCYENYLYDEPRFEFVDIKIRFVQRMIDSFTNSNRPDTMAHVGDLLHDILQKNETMADGKEIMTEIVSKKTLDKLFGVLNSAPSNTIVSHTCNAISTILIFYAAKKVKASPFGSPSIPGYSSYSSEFNETPITETVAENVATLNKFLKGEKEATLSTAYGQNIKPLGLTKLKVADIVDRILRIESNKIYSKITETGILKTLTGFFSTYMWNNLLHSIYTRIVHTVLSLKNDGLNETLLVQSELIQLLVKEIRDDNCELSKGGKKARKGNIGHIHIIANELIRIASENKNLDELLKKDPEWETVLLPQVKARNEALKREIGGYNPRTLQEELLAKILNSSPTKFNDSPGLKRDSITNLPIPQLSNIQPFSPGLPEPQNQMSAQPFAQSPSLSPIQSSPVETYQMGYSTTPPLEISSPISPIEPVKKESPLTSQVQPQRPYASEINLFDSRSEGPKPFMGEQRTIPEKQTSLMDGFKVFNKPVLEAEQINQEGSFEYGHTLSPRGHDSSKGYEGTIDPNGKYTSPTKHIGLFQRSYSSDLDSNTSPQRFQLARDLEDTNKDMYGIRNVSQETFATPSTQPTQLRSSMIDPRSGGPTRVKLKVKAAEKFDGNKIIDLLNRYKSPNVRTPAELTYSINSISESGLLSDDEFAVPGERAVKSVPVLLDDY